ncbi:GNAT family N-acetyltransferase [Candidatus Albibeggiatoa sp. nov. NOAA]|uniref:GNAT family N-acetyltransferase n=1 Tax=Candidatus Albibeggiatoa sp. nov. NOAA TaxID=3162724 RepID=UPI0033043258|nr:GNAT family N-acetyltransferase [Thiotrichaceae bacterium]
MTAQFKKLTLKPATLDDAEYVNRLINQAYRGQEGWTRETDIVDGKRSSIEDVRDLIKNPDSHILVAKLNEVLTACICVEEKEKQAYIGTFAVNPTFQNQGIGKIVLSLAEDYAVDKLGSQQLLMVVISQREELISFYERRGYQRTGKISEYPVHLNVGVPIIEGLTIEYLEKNITTDSC